ncbi:MAG: tetratricopeptide repeat protein [Calditrichaeota bacterium]|nr:tetratricopeptide repeat protein [Calditrichota bacterium]
MKNQKILLFIVFALLLGCGVSNKNASENQRITYRRYFLKGKQLLEQKELVQAEIYFNKALQDNPGFVPALNGIARIYLQRGQSDLADFYLQKALKIDPESLPLKITEAKLLIFRGEYEPAFENLLSLKKRIEVKKSKSLANSIRFNLAVAAFRLNKFETAKKEISALLALNPQNEKAKELLAKIEKKKKILKNLPASVREIGLKNVITRLDLAVLIDALIPGDFIRRPLPQSILAFYPDISVDSLNDLNKNEAGYAAVRYVLLNRLMWSYPDRMFRPNDPVTRGEFALVLERLFIVHNGKAPILKSAASNQTSVFEDVPRYHPAYRAAVFVKRMHLLTIRGKIFDLKKRISGEAALKALLRLIEL